MSTSPLSSSTSQPQAGSILKLRGIVFTALFAAMFIAFSSIQIPLWLTPIPITLQTLAVMLAGGLLGAVYGFWSITLVVLLTAMGIPLLHGNGGLSLLLGPTAGFIWMFPIAALLIGFVSDRLYQHNKSLHAMQFVYLWISIVVFGVLLEYAGGVSWLAHKAHLTWSKALSLGCLPFLAGDAVKSVVAALLIHNLRRYLPRLR